MAGQAAAQGFEEALNFMLTDADIASANNAGVNSLSSAPPTAKGMSSYSQIPLPDSVLISDNQFPMGIEELPETPVVLGTEPPPSSTEFFNEKKRKAPSYAKGPTKVLDMTFVSNDVEREKKCWPRWEGVASKFNQLCKMSGGSGFMAFKTPETPFTVYFVPTCHPEFGPSIGVHDSVFPDLDSFLQSLYSVADSRPNGLAGLSYSRDNNIFRAGKQALERQQEQKSQFGEEEDVDAGGPDSAPKRRRRKFTRKRALSTSQPSIPTPSLLLPSQNPVNPAASLIPLQSHSATYLQNQARGSGIGDRTHFNPRPTSAQHFPDSASNAGFQFDLGQSLPNSFALNLPSQSSPSALQFSNNRPPPLWRDPAIDLITTSWLHILPYHFQLAALELGKAKN